MKHMLPSQFTSGENSRNENKLPLNNTHEKAHDRVIHNHQKLGKYPSHEWANILCSRL